jgi:hypothetical protein
VRTDVPETPEFWRRIETELRANTPTPRRRRFGVPATAMRTLRTFTRHAVHSAAVVGLAIVMVVTWSKPMGETANVTIGSLPDAPAYLAQYGVSVDAESTVVQAQNRGYEVSVRRIFTPDPSEDGRILEERYPRPTTIRTARGPVLFVIGYTIGTGDANAN